MESGQSEPQGEVDESEAPDGDASETRRRRMRKFAARVDRHPGLLTATERLRRKLPGDERFGDPLSTAGSHAVEVMGRGVSGLRPGQQSVAQQLGLTGLQLWQSLSEATGRGRGDREMAILFTDLVEFSAWALKSGDTATLDLLREVGTALESAVDEHEGRIVKRLGDGMMATFLTPRAAVDAALQAQAAVPEINLDGHTPHMRAGIHWGSPRKLGGDYLGVDVNIAARVADAAKADQVLVSDALLARVDLDDLKTGRARRLRAEGAPRSLQVVEVSPSGET